MKQGHNTPTFDHKALQGRCSLRGIRHSLTETLANTPLAACLWRRNRRKEFAHRRAACCAGTATVIYNYSYSAALTLVFNVHS